MKKDAFTIKKEYILGLLNVAKDINDLEYLVNVINPIIINLDAKFVEKIYKRKGEEGVMDLIALTLQSRIIRENC